MPTGFFVTLVSALLAVPTFALASPACGGSSFLTGISWHHEVALNSADVAIETTVLKGSTVVSRKQSRAPVRDGHVEMPPVQSPIRVILNLTGDSFPLTCIEPTELQPGTGCFTEGAWCVTPLRSRPVRLAPRAPHGIRCEGYDMYANLSWTDEIVFNGNQVVVSYSENGQPTAQVVTMVRNGRISLGSAYKELLHFVSIETLKVEVYDGKTLRRLPGPFIYDDFTCARF